jgi:cholinesterase
VPLSSDNIKAFGGDASRITLFGQSGGSSSIDYYNYAWTKDPIAHAFILQSGAAPIAPGVRNDQNWFTVTKKLGCGDPSEEMPPQCVRRKPPLGNVTVIDCMRSKSSEEIMSAFSGLEFEPSKDWNNVVLRDYYNPLRDGKFMQKPILIGYTENEGTSSDTTTLLQNERIIPSGQPNATALGVTEEELLLCRVSVAALARSRRKIPVWLYSYAGDFPNQKTTPDLTTGPWHGSEVGLIFGTTSFTRALPDTPEQARLAKKMRKAWTSFAKAPETALDQLKWPQFSPNGTFCSNGFKSS